MNIYISSDHAGYELKFDLISMMVEKFKDYEVFDCGPYSEESVDYPVFAEKTCEKVLSDVQSLGILICGTGIGMSIAANKIKGIRAALCNDIFSASLARKHNDANILVLGSRVIGSGLAQEIVASFLQNKFEGGRHSERLALIKNLENRN